MKRFIAAIAALAMAAPAVASAQSWNGGDGDHHGGGYGDQHWGGDRSGDGDHRDGGAQSNDGGRYNDGAGQHGWRGDGDWRGGRGYGDRSASWYGRGGYQPSYYRGYAVSDYGRHPLGSPPRGYYWRRSGNDFVLAALATGLIYNLATSGAHGNNGYGYGYDAPGRHGYGQHDSYRGYGR